MKDYKRQGGETSKASGSTVILMTPALGSSLLFNYFSIGMTLTFVINICIFFFWGLVFEKDSNYDKSFFNKRLSYDIPIYSLLMSASFFLMYFLPSPILGALCGVVLFVLIFFSALKAEYSKSGRDFNNDFGSKKKRGQSRIKEKGSELN